MEKTKKRVYFKERTGEIFFFSIHATKPARVTIPPSIQKIHSVQDLECAELSQSIAYIRSGNGSPKERQKQWKKTRITESDLASKAP